MFEDRTDAGNKLSKKLTKYKKSNVFVVGLTRGGILVAKAISEKLNLRFIPLIVKKLSLPTQQELAVGAMVSPKDVYWNEDLCNRFGIKSVEKNKIVLEKLEEIKLLEEKLRIKVNWNSLNDKIVLLVDDGVATGASVIAGSMFLKRQKIKKIILATPVIAFDTYIDIKNYFDRVVYLLIEKAFYSVGQFYSDFREISDDETARIIKS